MLFIVGIGTAPSQLTLEALEALKSCQKAYLEDYTSQYSSGSLQETEKLIGKSFVPLGRTQVEEGFGPILGEARLSDIAFAVPGNPLDATTHVQILLDAKEKGVGAKTIPGIGVFGLISLCGLERYKFGRTTSIVFHEDGFEPESFYDAILDNKKLGLHTLCLLDIKKDENRLMGINHALSILESIEERREKNVIAESVLVGLAGIGSGSGQMKAGTLGQLKRCSFIPFPQSLIVCGRLNEKEIECLRAFSGLE